MFRTTTAASTRTTARRRLGSLGRLCAVGMGLALLTAIGCERMLVNEPSPEHIALQDGMGLKEAAGALGCMGANEASGMRTSQSIRTTEWNVEWRIGRVYELDRTKVVAIYSAWNSSDEHDAPPASAFRLVDWSMQETRSTDPITLWNGTH
jgi:hypothetical protein